MSLPKEPRQLMINLMYLVLTALLAMNVSSEILNAFKIIGKSISNSNKTVEARNTAFIDNFENYIKDPKVQEDKRKRVEAALELANQVNAKTSGIVSDIEKYKTMIIEASGGKDETGNIKQIENLDAGTRIMIKEGNGAKLLNTLKSFKDEIAGLVPVDVANIVAPGVGNNKAFFDELPLSFETERSDNNPSGDWSYGNFYMSPTIANVTLLDKYISDVRASQTAALDEIWSLATGEKKSRPFVTTKTLPDYAIIVAADNNYVLPGEKFRARIMMGTYNKKLKNLTFNVNGRTVVPSDGIAEFTDIAGAVGQKNINVTATFMDTVLDADGEKKLQPVTVKLEKPASYFVGEAQASISLDKMNVFYIGVPNPITLSASGIPAENLVATPENCTLTKVAGINKYEVTTTKPGKAKITLSGKLADGTTKNFGAYEYRVKYIPDPYPVVANKRGGAACVSELQAQIALFAKLEGFDFDAKFEVVSFDIFHTPRRGESAEGSSKSFYLNGPNADGDVQAIMKSLKLGSKLYFDNIRARGPDGRTRNIGGLVFVINC